MRFKQHARHPCITLSISVVLLACHSSDAFTLSFPRSLRSITGMQRKKYVSQDATGSPGANKLKSNAILPRSRERVVVAMNPNPEELRQQKAEALQSLADFNDGSWSGRAISFSVTSDVAAGVTKRKILKQYTTSVSTQFGLGGDGLKMVETFQWDSDENGGGGTCISTRSTKLERSADIDAVDGSYSTDSSLLDLPSTLTGTSALVKFAIENSLAVNDHERSRCFLLYGMEDQLVRIVICDEFRVDGEGVDAKSLSSADSSVIGGGDFKTMSASEEDDMSVDIERLVGKITGEDVTSKLKARSSTDQGVEDPITADSTVDERMERLQRAFDDAKQKQVGDFSALASNENIRFPVDLYSLSMGVWLGDAVIRDQSKEVSGGKKGFGVTKTKKSFGDGFAEWAIGVQKVGMTFKWDFDETVRQVVAWGRSMGAYTDEAMPSSSMGVVNDELMSRRLKPEERMMYIDFDMGKYAGIVLGSAMVKVSIETIAGA
mmetsp:Transcript_2814/g.7394  ORF Transcript_2814/g.7394 Transcript_2814/m.7394 type:complete len:491 (-) Transcript_2814:670-2142(-)